jgi:hypothetical protein
MLTSTTTTTIPFTVTSATTTTSSPPKSDKLIEEQVSAGLTPLFQLCKDRPEEGNFFQQAICWALFALYLMLIVSLVLHQLCSIFWLKNGQRANHINLERKPGDRASLSGLLRQ